jgi:hypothetical protein
MIEPKDEDISFEAYCDLVEREIGKAVEDMAFIRAHRLKAKDRCQLLRAALANARRYLRELEEIL